MAIWVILIPSNERTNVRMNEWLRRRMERWWSLSGGARDGEEGTRWDTNRRRENRRYQTGHARMNDWMNECPDLMDGWIGGRLVTTNNSSGCSLSEGMDLKGEETYNLHQSQNGNNFLACRAHYTNGCNSRERGWCGCKAPMRAMMMFYCCCY